MPFSQDIETDAARLAGPGPSPTRRSRNVSTGTQGSVAEASRPDGLTEDGRAAAGTAVAGREHARGIAWPPEPPVLGPGTVAVLFDGGDAGRAALTHALSASSGPLMLVHFWAPADPVVVARLGEHPSAAAQLLQALHEGNERAQAEAERIADDGVALAAEAGRDAVALVQREEGATREMWIRQLVAEHGIAQLVLAADRPSRWRRLVAGPGHVERLAADPPCPCTLVPVTR
jgi:nucleotide-binding universal stress UspA family protein